MTDAEFRTSAKEAAQATHMLAAMRLAEFAADPDADIEVVRKIYNDTKDVAGAVPEKKIDPNANLRTFSITFINGSLQATVQPAADLELVETVQLDDDALPTLSLGTIGHDQEQLPVMAPSKFMLSNYSINADLSGLEE